MAEMGEVCGFPSNLDMPRPFTLCKTELPRKTELQPIKSPNGLVYPRVEVEQRTHTLGTRMHRERSLRADYNPLKCADSNFQPGLPDPTGQQ